MRILIIEDDAMIQNSLATHLRAACFAVDTADTGDRGSVLARMNDYDLILLDYQLPNKDGKQILTEIRASGKTVPVLMLTVRFETGDKVEILNAGADDYLTKPFSMSELDARIRALLRRPKTITAEIITIGDMIIDSQKQTVRCGGKPIYLTRKEFGLLEYLARNEGYVISRGMIMEHVWDQDSDPFSNTIEAHILNLRKKLGRLGHQLIHTVPGRGYKVEAT